MIMWKGSVQLRNKARARSATRSSFAVRTRKPLQKVKCRVFAVCSQELPKRKKLKV